MPKKLYGCEGGGGFVGQRVVLYIVEWTALAKKVIYYT